MLETSRSSRWLTSPSVVIPVDVSRALHRVGEVATMRLPPAFAERIPSAMRPVATSAIGRAANVIPAMRVAPGPVLTTTLYQRNHSAGRRLHAAATKQIVAGSQPSLIGCARTITAAPSRTTNSTNGPMFPSRRMRSASRWAIEPSVPAAKVVALNVPSHAIGEMNASTISATPSALRQLGRCATAPSLAGIMRSRGRPAFPTRVSETRCTHRSRPSSATARPCARRLLHGRGT